MDTRFWNFRMGLLDSLFFDEVLDHAIHNAPLDEVELGDSSHESLEFYASRTTKWVEELLGITVKARLVCHVDRKHLAVWGGVCDVLVLGIVGDEPFQLAKGDAVAMLNDVMQLLLVIRRFEKLD
jgi:hypothetical protein